MDAASRSRTLAGGVDPLLATAVVGLAISGIAVSGSARAFEEAVAGGVPRGVGRSLVHLGLGLIVMGLVALVDYRRLSRPAVLWGLLVVTSGLLIATLVAGPQISNTHRWLQLGGIGLQPSELAKPVLVLAVAATLARAGDGITEWSNLTRPLLICAWLSALVLAGRDLGTPVLLVAVTLVMAYAAGALYRHAALLAAGGSVLFTLFAWIDSYRIDRLAGFAAALRFPHGSLDDVPYQVRQSLVAIGSGGIWGKGFGLSTQKAFFLPEADNDFVFSIVAEELGLVGALAVIAAFLVLAWRGLATADRAPDRFGRLLALGATWLICGQALCHLGVGTGLLPAKGLPLPFLSAGGSSMVASCALIGLVLNVSLRRCRHAV